MKKHITDVSLEASKKRWDKITPNGLITAVGRDNKGTSIDYTVNKERIKKNVSHILDLYKD